MQVSRRILFGGMLYVAIALLPHLKHLMDRIALIRVERQRRCSLLKWAGEQVVRANETCIWTTRCGGSASRKQNLGALRKVRIALREQGGWRAICVDNSEFEPNGRRIGILQRWHWQLGV